MGWKNVGYLNCNSFNFAKKLNAVDFYLANKYIYLTKSRCLTLAIICLKIIGFLCKYKFLFRKGLKSKQFLLILQKITFVFTYQLLCLVLFRDRNHIPLDSYYYLKKIILIIWVLFYEKKNNIEIIPQLAINSGRGIWVLFLFPLYVISLWLQAYWCL